MKVLSVVGARPQFIKAFAISRILRENHEEHIVHTGQHYDYELSDVFFDELDIPSPAYHLGVGSASHGRQTAAVMRSFEPLLATESPDAVLVYGDTNSTVGAALVAAKFDTVLGHVEAGLRSGNRTMPEEINRIVTDHIANLLFAPTDEAVANLGAEGLADRTVQTGDVMYDTLLWARERVDTDLIVSNLIGEDIGSYLLFTVHRQANTDRPARLKAIVDAMMDRHEPVIFPIHPRTEEALARLDLLDQVTDELTVIDPVSYLRFIALIDGAKTVVTDSGGVQKEAFFLETPCVTLREETEWPETNDAGMNTLVGADSRSIHQAIDGINQVTPGGTSMPFGDGTAAESVITALEEVVSGHIPADVQRPPG